MTGDPEIANMNQFLVKKNSKTGNTNMPFLDGKSWQSLTNKGTSEFLVAKTLKKKKNWLIKCYEKCLELR